TLFTNSNFHKHTVFFTYSYMHTLFTSIAMLSTPTTDHIALAKEKKKCRIDTLYIQKRPVVPYILELVWEPLLVQGLNNLHLYLVSSGHIFRFKRFKEYPKTAEEGGGGGVSWL